MRETRLYPLNQNRDQLRFSNTTGVVGCIKLHSLTPTAEATIYLDVPSHSMAMKLLAERQARTAAAARRWSFIALPITGCGVRDSRPQKIRPARLLEPRLLRFKSP